MTYTRREHKAVATRVVNDILAAYRATCHQLQRDIDESRDINTVRDLHSRLLAMETQVENLMIVHTYLLTSERRKPGERTRRT